MATGRSSAVGVSGRTRPPGENTCPRPSAAERSGLWARFDDLPAGAALHFGTLDRALVATSPSEVIPVIDEVHRATAAGAWAFGYLSYEAASALDPSLPVHVPSDGLPLAVFGVGGEPTEVPVIEPVEAGTVGAGRWRLAWDRSQYRAAVDAVHDHIAAGDTYQVNLTSRFTAPFGGDPLMLYACLAHAQNGRYNAYLDVGRFVIASASPELFFDIRDHRVRVRPMKGTAPRGRTVPEDEALARALRASAKERAENLMIVDLVRNDLGRIGVPGSVRVTSLFRHERYETVHQLTSEVTAEIEHGAGLTDIFRALFPCGSVTGAPKERSMGIIRALEPGPRGVYCGAIGFVAPPGARHPTRFSVAIRTAEIDRRTGQCSYGAGGGITWESHADREYEELITKARILPVAQSPITVARDAMSGAAMSC